MSETTFTDQQALAFIGPRGNYYLPRWRQLEAEGKMVAGFNWGAFFGGLAWLLYRRMYRAFWIGFGVCFALGFLEVVATEMIGVEVPPAVDNALLVAIMVTFGVFGTYWYFRFANRIAAPLLASESAQLDDFRKAGGARPLNLWLCLGVAAALLIFLAWVDTLPPPQT
ncbi:MAG TPA: DUF2628 domain-containing protein [Gemmatimonadales bacterium]|nr:DUF2628 domain-containing protein [Gemmatimonadales bacterium]